VVETASYAHGVADTAVERVQVVLLLLQEGNWLASAVTDLYHIYSRYLTMMSQLITLFEVLLVIIRIIVDLI
jgi:hypothetical protein